MATVHQVVQTWDNVNDPHVLTMERNVERVHRTYDRGPFGIPRNVQIVDQRGEYKA
jgi:hypothetical protein